MTVTNWKKKPDPRHRMTARNRRRQDTWSKIQNDRKRLEGNDDKMDMAAVKAAVKRWRKRNER